MSEDVRRRPPGLLIVLGMATVTAHQMDRRDPRPTSSPVRVGLCREDVMTAREVADLLSMLVSTVYHLARQGELPARRLGRTWRFLRPRIEELSVPERLTSELVVHTPARAVADSLTLAATIPSRRADEWSRSWPLTGFGDQVTADIFGHLGPIAPGAYSVYRLSLHSNGALRDINGWVALIVGTVLGARSCCHGDGVQARRPRPRGRAKKPEHPDDRSEGLR
jgi:excisionase family DNA binding protein